MIRTISTVSITLALVFYAVSLIQTGEREENYVTWQEALLYELTPERALSMAVPADTDRLVFDLVGIINPPAVYDAHEMYPFELELVAQTARGRRKRWVLWASPRVSLSEFPPKPGTRRGTRLLDPRVWGTDSVERMVDLDGMFDGVSGTATLTPRPARVDTVLARVFAEKRTLLAFDEMRSRSLPRDERRELGQLGSGLGFSDVPNDALLQAVRRYRVRLDTLGKRGRDYVLRRVMVSDYRASEAEELARPSFSVSPKLWAAFNFEGDVRMHIEGLPHERVLWGIGPTEMPARELELDAEGRATLDIDLPAPASVVVASPRPTSLSVSISEATLEYLVSDGRQIYTQRGVRYMLPDYRRFPWTILSPRDLSCFELGSHEGQRKVLLALRASGDVKRVEEVYHQSLPSGRAKTWRDDMVTSTFEVWIDGQRSTDTVYEKLNVPEDAERVCLRGPDLYLARAFAEDESVEGDVYEKPYDRLSERGYLMLNAPREIRRWVPLAPVDSYGVPLGEGHARMLVAQVRMVQRDPGELELTAQSAARLRGEQAAKEVRSKLQKARREGIRSLLPEGVVHGQRLFVSAPRRPGLARHDLWTDVTRPRGIRADASEQVTIAFRAPPPRLPAKVEVLVDGVQRASADLRVPVQSIALPLAAGTHTIEVLAPEGVQAFARAPAADFEPVYVERFGYELGPGSSLSYRVPVKRGENLGLAIEVFSERRFAPYRLHLRVSGRLPETYIGITNDHPIVRFWDRDFSGLGGSLAARVDLPVPRAQGEIAIALESKGEERLFVRAALLGQKPEERTSSISVTRERGEP